MLRTPNISKLIAPIALLLVAVYSCNQPVVKSPLAEYGSIFENVVRLDQGVFRGYNLGESIDTITAKEPKKPKEQDENYLYYEYKIDSITTYNTKYSFDESGLNEIESDIFIANDTNLTEETFNNFKSYFDKHYGESQTEGGYTIWTVKSEKYGDVRINLGNELPAFNDKTSIGKISLWIYTDKH